MMKNLDEAVACYNAGRLHEAESLTREFLAEQPDDPVGLHLLGTLCLADGRIEEAHEFFERAIHKNNQHPDIHNSLGTIYRNKAMLDKAIDHFDMAIQSWLTYPSAHANLNAALAKRGKADDRFLVSIITPTMGTEDVARAIESVQAQTYPNIEHLVVADGPNGEQAVRKSIPQDPQHPVHLLTLPYNTGADGFNGHRIYGAMTHLVHGRYVCFLDEDNWFDPNHISLMMEMLTARGLQWVYALRKIFEGDGPIIGRDDCQSLGRWATWYDPAVHLVDVNCYLVRHDIALALNTLWHRRSIPELREGPDFQLCKNLMAKYPDFDTSGLYTVNYKVGNTDISATEEFFVEGNEVMRQRHPDGYPWARGVAEE